MMGYAYELQWRGEKNRKLNPSAEIPNNNPALVGGGSYSSEQIVV